MPNPKEASPYPDPAGSRYDTRTTTAPPTTKAAASSANRLRAVIASNGLGDRGGWVGGGRDAVAVHIIRTRPRRIAAAHPVKSAVTHAAA